MSVFSAKRQVSRPRATAAAKKSQTLDPAIALATRKEAESLLKTEIRFIYAAEFETLEDDQGPVTAVIMLIVVVAVQQLEAHVLQP